MEFYVMRYSVDNKIFNVVVRETSLDKAKELVSEKFNGLVTIFMRLLMTFPDKSEPLVIAIKDNLVLEKEMICQNQSA